MTIHTFIEKFIMCATLNDKGKAIKQLIKRRVDPGANIQQQAGQQTNLLPRIRVGFEPSQLQHLNV
jgi:hypothetical protein